MNRLLDALLNFLRSPGAMVIALMLALLPQGEHTAQVVQYFSHNAKSQPFSYAFAAAVEVAVLLFVMAGHRRISGMFAVASFLTNVVYYSIGDVNLLSVAALPVLLLSALLPACIMGYSHTVADKTTHDTTASPPATQPVDAVDAPHLVQLTRVTPAATVSTDSATDGATVSTDVAHLVSLSNAEIARRCNVSRQTVAKWREGDVLAVKLADKLPQPATMHSNGVNHE